MLVITYNNSSEDVNSEDEFDKIEILSSNIETADEFFLAPISSFSKKELSALDIRERQRKRIARIVALVSGILLLVSVALVTFSLYMAKDIDELVRNSNEMLKKHNDRMLEALAADGTAANSTSTRKFETFAEEGSSANSTSTGMFEAFAEEGSTANSSIRTEERLV